jgi:3-methyladenine DNA glycosylase AlkD
VRLFALFLLVEQYTRDDEAGREAIYTRYLANTQFINNWDLVDSSAHQIVGAWLANRSLLVCRFTMLYSGFFRDVPA